MVSTSPLYMHAHLGKREGERVKTEQRQEGEGWSEEDEKKVKEQDGG